ncbi:hypothetical protein J6590_060176 [Homalodisca vitripennis]|nr:hypothetical protein J6590_060176 [Homalodisca vitripennis]
MEPTGSHDWYSRYTEYSHCHGVKLSKQKLSKTITIDGSQTGPGEADPFQALFYPSSWATGLCEDLIKQIKGESRYSISRQYRPENRQITGNETNRERLTLDYSACSVPAVYSF